MAARSWHATTLAGQDAMNLGRAEGGVTWTAGHNVLAKSTDGGRTWQDVRPDGLPHGVNLVAYLGFPVGGGQSQIDLVPEDSQSLQEVVERAGMTLSEAKRAFLVQGDDRAGAVADTTAKLAEANINVTAAAAASAGSGRYGMILWVAPADYERAADALGA